jgi:hypothetical protein
VLLRRQLDSHRGRLHAQVDALAASGARASREQLLELHESLGRLQLGLAAVTDLLTQMTSEFSWGGRREEPGKDGGKPEVVFDPSRVAPPQRAAELRELALLTSDEMDGHLMFLGEWYLMDLFAWSDVLWPRFPASGPTQYTLAEPKAAVPNYSLIGKLRPDAIEQSRRKGLEFAAGLPRARRVLANVPTYMIFDDHEVTDDWNLHEDWVRLVHTSPAGPTVIRNALAAYAVFQDWGNQPDDYLPGRPGRAILDALRSATSPLGEPRPPPPWSRRRTAPGRSTRC